MQFIRPFTSESLHFLKKSRALGFDFIELLVPEPEDGLDAAEVRRICEGEGLGLVLAARVNLQRSIASEEAAARAGGRDYLKYCIEAAEALGATIVGGPLYGEPLVFAGRPPFPGRPSRSPPAPPAPSRGWPKWPRSPRARARSSGSSR